MPFNNDKYLPTRGAEGEEDAVEDEGGELGHEDEGGVECPLLQQRRRRQDDGEEVDAAHHLHRAHLVHREQLVLPRRREGVKRHVAWKVLELIDGFNKYFCMLLNRIKGSSEES